MKGLVEQFLNHYQIEEQPGEGGVVTVYNAFDTRLECNLAMTDHFSETVTG